MAENGSIRERWTRVVSSASSSGAEIPVASASETQAFSGGHRPETQPEILSSSAELSASSTGGTFIGNGALFEGTLTLRGDFRIDTEFRGELETDGTITIENSGSVVGSIRAREVVIRGAVVGNVIAPRQLTLESTGKLHGDIETACLEIQKHAVFQGTTSMSQPQTTRRGPIAAEREPRTPQVAHPNA